MEFSLNLAPQDPAQREAMIRAGLLNADGTPRPIRVDMGNNGGVFDDAGRRLLSPISPSDVHESAEIPTYLSGYRNGEYRADQAATIQPVDYRTDKYRKNALANTFKRRNTQVAFDGAVPEIDVSTSLTEYTVNDYAIGTFVSLTTERNEGSATAFRSRMAGAKICANAIQLDREYRVWAALATSGNWNAANVQTLSSTTKWNGGSAADPVQNIRDMMAASMSKITSIWMNEQVAGDLLAHPSFREHMRQMLGDGTPAPNVAQMLTQIDRGEGSYDFVVPGFPAFKVVTGKYTSTDSETATATRLLGSHVIGVRTLAQAPVSGEDVATYTTFRWKGVSGTGWQSREFDVPNRGMQGGRMVVVCMSEVDAFTANRVGGLILNAHA